MGLVAISRKRLRDCSVGSMRIFTILKTSHRNQSHSRFSVPRSDRGKGYKREAPMRLLGGLSFLCGVLALSAFLVVLGETALADNQQQKADVNSIDLESLKNSIRKTDAIGLAEKLSLKRDLDRLVEKLQAFHEGSEADNIEKMESSFHKLINKTLTLLRSEDPDLHQRISATRSQLWSLLRDPKTFQAMVVVEEPTYNAM